MNKKELIEAIAKKEGRTPEAVAYSLSLAYDEIFAAIVEEVAKGKSVEVPGFGTFYRTEKHLSRICKPYIRLEPRFNPDLSFRDAVRDNTREVQP